MDCQAIAFSKLPQQSKLFVRYAENFSQVRRFYAHPPTLSSVRKVAREVFFPEEHRKAVAAILREQNDGLGAGEDTFESLKRLEQGAVAVVTGQQVGLFTGPAYSIYKAVAAVQVARDLTRMGLGAVPVFWMATEDHDVAEVDHCGWLAGRKLLRLELDADHAEGQPVGSVQLGEGMRLLLEKATGALEGEAADRVEAWLRESYAPAETYGSAFGKLMARVFAGHGLILLDPMSNGLHRIASSIYQRALAGHSALTEALLGRNREIERAEFRAQVRVRQQGTLLFLLQGAKRVPLRTRNGKLAAGEELFEEKELAELAAAEPWRFSPSALLRPVVQDALVPTVCTIAGPAEIAYYAQSSVLYEQLRESMPVILPRPGFTIVERTERKLLERYGLRIADVWLGRQAIRCQMEERALPSALARNFNRGAVDLERLLDRIEKPLAKLDKTLVGAAETARRKMIYQLEKLRRKAGRASDFRKGVLAEHERQLFDALFPEHALQERSLCLVPFLARHGTAFLGELRRRIDTQAQARHLVLFPE
jgi:bacillithiol biosynthesis cysteine-adding enzyme BshC